MAKRYAVVDIGTNSVRLMIAEETGGNIKAVLKTLNTVRTGEGVALTGSMTEGAMQRTVDALCGYKQTAILCGAEQIWFFATSAVREAQNREELLRRVYERCGIAIDVISGEEEARIGFLGAAGTGERRGIIDIGGGSTEVICGRDETLDYVKSFKVGTVRALSLYPQANETGDFDAARSWVQKTIAELAGRKEFAGVPFIGIGGTATALAAIALELKTYVSQKVQGYVLTADKLADIFAMLSGMTVEQRKSVIGLEPMRADVIAFGCAILQSFMSVIGISEIEVSDRDNQEGYLMKKLGL